LLLPKYELWSSILYHESVPDLVLSYCDLRVVDVGFTAPTHYHMSSRSGKAYTGDRHPDYRGNLVVQGPERDTMFEKSARECGNCGETKICMTKKGIQRETQEYLRLWG
jgi:hypothetical protein